MKNSYESLQKRIHDNTSTWESVVKSCTLGNTEERAADVEKFFEDKNICARSTLTQVCEKTRVAARFLTLVQKSEQLDRVNNYFGSMRQRYVSLGKSMSRRMIN